MDLSLIFSVAKIAIQFSLREILITKMMLKLASAKLKIIKTSSHLQQEIKNANAKKMGRL